MSTAVGDRVQDFTLVDNLGEQQNLGESLKKGPVVLAFFPLAFTGVCTAEMCEFRDALKDFESVNATVFGISVDSGPTLRVFAEQQNLNFRLLSDFNKEVCASLDVKYDDFRGMKGVAKRSVFVIRQDGTVAYRWVTENAGESPNVPEVQTALSSL